MTESKVFPKVIIITHNYDEANKLHKIVDGNDKFQESHDKAMYPADKKRYNAVWYWAIDNKDSLHGSSGSGAESSMKRNSGLKEKVTLGTFIRQCELIGGPEWKIDHDPFIKDFKKDGLTAVEETGYFIDSTTKPEDIDYMLDIPTTPIATVQENLKRRKPKNPVVLLCTGSFCPPHQGHIDMMEAAGKQVEENGFEVLGGYFSPGHDEYINHKAGEKSIPIHKRIAMTEEVCPPWVSVDPWEGIFNKHAIMFTHVVERLEKYLERHLGQKVPVWFVCGADNYAYMNAFRKKGHCVVVGRPGHKSPGMTQYKDYVKGVLNNGELIEHHIMPKEKWLEKNKDKWGEGTFTYAYCNNPQSSTKVRDNMVEGYPGEQKTNLHLRVEDTLFEEAGASWRDLFNIVSDEYNDVTMSLLSEQKEDFKDISKVGNILSLDPFMPGTCNLRVSRHYDWFGAKMLYFDRSPEADPLKYQLKCVENKEFYIFDDDIHTTGGTVRYVSGLLDQLGYKNKGAMTFKVSDDSEGEILDLRDFLIHDNNCGLVMRMPDGSGVRAPYMYPYVCPFARASVTDPLGFSIRIWEYNKEFHEKAGTVAKDLGSMGELFAYAGMVESDNELVSDVCERHIQLLKKLKH